MKTIPYNTSIFAITSLTFQKFHSNQLLKNFVVNVAKVALFIAGELTNGVYGYNEVVKELPVTVYFQKMNSFILKLNIMENQIKLSRSYKQRTYF